MNTVHFARARLALATLMASAALLSSLAPAFADEVLDSITVPDGFSVTRAVKPGLVAYPMFMTFDEVGRMYIAESTGKDLSGKEMAAEPECQILRLEDRDGDGVYDHRTIFAESLSLPMGVLWHDGSLFVASPPEFIRFDDTDRDGVADERTVLLEGWNVLNTASLHGPYLGPDGWLYLTHGRHGYRITSQEGAVYEGLAARIWRCRPDGTGLERYAGGGFDNPVELIFTPSGAMLGTMTYFTDPRHGQRDGLMHWVWGGVYPKPHESVNEFVRTGSLMPTMTKFSRIAPSGLAQYRGTAFGDAYTGDLFSAQFNPHRIQRHRLIREGATYRTEDSDFLTSTFPDFYPTDVLEDADGSLLVCDTGAWYVDACPISRVAKPDVKGSIYRIAKSDATPIGDPWGREIPWSSLDVAEVVSLLGDGRPRVRARALESVVSQGNATVEALAASVNGRNAIARPLAVSALWRMASEDARRALRSALESNDATVRELAIRALGELGDGAAIPALESLLSDATAPERAQAAEALGKLGATQSVPHLLTAADAAVDRFEDHAIVYALISIGERAPLLEALDSNTASWASRRAALVALDQLEAEELTAERAMPLLDSPDEATRQTALWVASHHPEWAGDVLGSIQTRLSAGAPDAAATGAYAAIVSAYANTTACESFMAGLLGDAANPAALREWGLDVSRTAARATLPDAWATAVGTCLESEHDGVRAKALATLRERDIDTHDEAVARLADDGEAPGRLRVQATALLARRDRPALDDRLDFVIDQLKTSDDPVARQEAARLLHTAGLEPAAKIRVVRSLSPKADAVALLTILSLAEGETDAQLGAAVVDGLTENALAERLLSAAQLDTALGAFPEAVREDASALRARVYAREADKVERFLALEPKLGTGDVGRGRAVFFSEEARCATCHAIGDEGGTLGPDLTTIGVVRTGHDLLESILFPSASIVPESIPYVVETDDEELSGIIGEETAGAVLLKIGAGEERRIPRGAIRAMRASTVSMMPEGLDAAITEQQLIDLVTFLQSLNNEVWLLPQAREAD